MNITNIEMRRCLSGYESNHTLVEVARLTWQEGKQAFGVEMEVSPGEDDLLAKLAKCLDLMLQSLEHRRLAAAGDDAPVAAAEGARAGEQSSSGAQEPNAKLCDPAP